MKYSLFAVCAPGLAPYTQLECVRLDLLAEQEQQVAAGQAVQDADGVEFEADLRQLYLANLHLRTASRVLVRFGEFFAASFSELRKRASRLEWEHYLAPGQPVSLRVTCHKSRLYHSDAVAERIAGAIGDRLGVQPAHAKHNEETEQADAPQLIVVRLQHDQCTISIDSSGELLHRRGYRLAVAKAPLRETLAAGLLMASGWDYTTPLLDPFCGSGTIAIEAAMMARNIAPGYKRKFAFMNWPGYDKKLWLKLIEESRQGKRHISPRVFASDRDAGAVEMAGANARRAGVGQDIQVTCRAVSDIDPLEHGWVVTNPPYGLRVSSDKDLRNLYAQTGHVLRAKCPGSQLTILSSERSLLGQLKLKLDTQSSFVNGGVRVWLGKGKIPG